MKKHSIIYRLCKEYTNLKEAEIAELEDAAKRLSNMASLFDADAFIDCLIADGSGNSIVIAEAKPSVESSSYKGSVVGMIAYKEKEPAVLRTLSLGVTTRYMKAETQEQANVIQTVDPIIYNDKVIGVYIIEQKMEWFETFNRNYHLAESDDIGANIDVPFVGEDRIKVVDTIEQGMMFVNYDGIVTFCNRAMVDTYSQLGFMTELVGSRYSHVCLLNVESDDFDNCDIYREIKVGNYYFSIKHINLQSADIKFVVTLTNITTKKNQERALVLKSVAFQEMHHRVKNNLQTIASLLRLQKNKVKSIEGKEALDNSINRILAISATHEIILNADLEELKLIDVIDNIKENMQHYMVHEELVLNIVCRGGDFTISFDQASAVALILNELMQNSMKHAFKNRVEGNIYIQAALQKEEGNQIVLLYGDDGCGYDVAAKFQEGTMGLKIIKLMVEEKLKGYIKISSTAKGTQVKILF